MTCWPSSTRILEAAKLLTLMTQNIKGNGDDLIRVAVTRDISQAVPIAGSFIGTPNDYLGMTVDVSVVSENRGCARMASRS